jgi:hypothetical protein
VATDNVVRLGLVTAMMGGSGGVTDLAAEWPALSMEGRRAIIATVVEPRIGPARGARNRFDETDRAGLEYAAAVPSGATIMLPPG